MTIIGAAHSPWFFWDGRTDSQWSQALGPLESPVEHAITRSEVTRLVAGDRGIRRAYEQVFGPLPERLSHADLSGRASPLSDRQARDAWDSMPAGGREAVNRVFSNVGKAIAAYQRRIMPGPSRFDQYVSWLADGADGPSPLSDDEIEGIRIFIGSGKCLRCHSGPLFTNNDFHNTGLSPHEALPPDDGRASGVGKAVADPFNCLGQYSDAGQSDCAELRFAKTGGSELRHAFKTPTLRNLSVTAPYMHDGRFHTLAGVLAHYKEAPKPAGVGSELERLELDRDTLGRLEAFLRTLDGPIDAPAEFLRPPE